MSCSTVPDLAQMRVLIEDEVRRAAGSPDVDLAAIIGQVHPLPPMKPTRADWGVVPGGTPAEQALIVKAAEVVRTWHPRARLH